MPNDNKISEIKLILEDLSKEIDSLNETDMISHLKWEDIFSGADMLRQKLNTLRIEQERHFMSKYLKKDDAEAVLKEKDLEIKRLNQAMAELKRSFSDLQLNISKSYVPNLSENNTLEVDKKDIFAAAVEHIPESENDFELEFIDDLANDGQEPAGVHPKPDWMLDEIGYPVEDLSLAITLNDKIYFINELFQGDGEQYRLSIQRLNDMSSMKEALEYLRRAFPEWDENSSEIYRFYMILRRRYNE